MVLSSIAVLIAGLVVGSFLNVVIYRLPRGRSLWSPSSHCPNCLSSISWYDNLPLVSFFLLGGKCRNCKEPIPWRYPLVEGVCAALFLLALWQNYSTVIFSFSLILNLVKSALFVSILIPIFFIDLEHQIIPDSLSYTLIVSGFFFSAIKGNLTGSVVGAGVGAGLFLLILCLSFFLLHQAGMGIGDIKMAAGIGAFLGWEMALLSYFLSFLIGALLAGALLLLSLKKMKDKVPFGPFLVAGALISFFWGDRIVSLYLSLFW